MLEWHNLFIEHLFFVGMVEKDIGKITKNADTDIVIRIDDFGGKIGLTIREFVNGERYQGFTKAGTRIPADQFKVFKELVNSVDEEELGSLVNDALAAQGQETLGGSEGSNNVEGTAGVSSGSGGGGDGAGGSQESGGSDSGSASSGGSSGDASSAGVGEASSPGPQGQGSSEGESGIEEQAM